MSFMDGLGAAANGAAEMMGERMKADTVAARDAQLASQTEARDRRLAVFKEDLDAKRAETVRAMQLRVEQENSQRDIKQYDQISDAARDSANSRTAKSMQQLGADFSASDANELSPAVRNAYEKAGLIGTATAASDLKDRSEAARSLGASPAMRKEIDASYAAQVKSDQAKSESERKERSDAAKDETKNAQILAVLKASGDRTQAYRDRPPAGSGSSEPKLRSTFDGPDGAKMGVMSDGTTIELSTSSLNFNKSVAKVVTDMEKNDFKFNKLPAEEKKRIATERLSGVKADDGATEKPAPAKPVASLPTGAKQVGTSGGKPVFETPDGKRFIGN